MKEAGPQLGPMWQEHRWMPPPMPPQAFLVPLGVLSSAIYGEVIIPHEGAEKDPLSTCFTTICAKGGDL